MCGPVAVEVEGERGAGDGGCLGLFRVELGFGLDGEDFFCGVGGGHCGCSWGMGGVGGSWGEV